MSYGNARFWCRCFTRMRCSLPPLVRERQHADAIATVLEEGLSQA